MRISIMGTGGVGGYFGGVLAKAGEDVWFIARGEHLRMMKERGLTIRSIAGDFTLPVNATDEPRQIGHIDLVLFCVKTYDTDGALNKLAPAVAKDTVILPLQNGVESAERIGAVIGVEKVLGGAAYIESAIAAPGVIEQKSQIRKIEFGELDGSLTKRAKDVLNVLIGAGIDAYLRPDIRKALWDKLLWIAAGAGMTAVARATIGEILESPETREMFISAMHEVDNVARASGVKLDSDVVERTLKFAQSLDPRLKTSMLRDVERGNRLEIDAINGAVVRFGAKHLVPTPVNGFIYGCLKLEDRKNVKRLSSVRGN